MVTIRIATSQDLLNIQNCNLLCLPENYQQKYFMYHLMSWPTLSFVAECTAKKEIVGYVLAKLDDEVTDKRQGHITSLSVQRKWRRQGIAYRLMIQAAKSMIQLYNTHFVALHVRKSNRAAFNLYSKVLGYEHVETEEGYYADGEDGLYMRLNLVEFAKSNDIQPAFPEDYHPDYPGFVDRKAQAAEAEKKAEERVSKRDLRRR